MSDDITVRDPSSEWSDFLSSVYRNQIDEISRIYPEKESLIISFPDLESFGKLGLDLADRVLDEPDSMISEIRDAIRDYNLIPVSGPVYTRFVNIPRKIRISDLRKVNGDKLASFEGIVRKVTEVKPRLQQAVFRCSNGHRIVVKQGYGPLREPERCTTDGCTSRSIEFVQKFSTFIDSQKIRLQESPEGLRGGRQPASIDVDLTDDLTGKVFPGDRIVVNGVIRFIRNHSQRDSSVFDKYIEAISLEIKEADAEDLNITEEEEQQILALSREPRILDKISRSIAPTLQGMDELKRAACLQMFGGIAKLMPDGSRIRGDIHVFVCGEPGIAKSQLLRYLASIAPRSVYTSGQSATAAGLTAAAVKDDFGGERWTIEAGILVIADMGGAYVDEMDKMSKTDRSSLHEAMEQQTISIAKAGISATLQCRCYLFAAANPKRSRFDEYTPIGEQIDMPASLLSRFDLIFIETDKPEQSRDAAISKHILNNHRVGELISRGMATEGDLKSVSPEIPADFLRKYIAFAKKNCFPIMSQEASDDINAYYLKIRSLAQTSRDKAVPITARSIEGLVRLAESSARSRLSDEITRDDAKEAIRLVDSCLRQIAYDPQTGTFDVDRVLSGQAASSRQIEAQIEQAMRDQFNGSRVERTALVDYLAGKGLDRHRVEEIIGKMLTGGKMFEPKLGVLKGL